LVVAILAIVLPSAIAADSRNESRSTSTSAPIECVIQAHFPRVPPEALLGLRNNVTDQGLAALALGVVEPMFFLKPTPPKPIKRNKAIRHAMKTPAAKAVLRRRASILPDLL
jgi:hypothetical protein